jgi:hypothetical protein
LVVVSTRWNGWSAACAVWLASASAARRLRRDHRGGDAERGDGRHDEIAEHPGRAEIDLLILQSTDDEQHARGRDQCADPIGRDIGGHAGGLLVLAQAFDAVGVDQDVLRGGGGRDQQRGDEDDRPGEFRGIAKAEHDDGRDHHDLREHEPPAAPAEPAREQRHIERIDDRRPQELDGVGRADQGEQADGLEVD